MFVLIYVAVLVSVIFLIVFRKKNLSHRFVGWISMF